MSPSAGHATKNWESAAEIFRAAAANIVTARDVAVY